MIQVPKLTLTTPPGVEPVTAADVAAFLGASASDPILSGLAVTARTLAESYLGMGFITQTWTQFYDLLPVEQEWWDGVREGPITQVDNVPAYFNLARWPVASVTSVKFADEASVLTTADAATYYLSKTSRPPQIALKSGQVWPSLIYRIRDAVEIQYVVGYGAAAADVPEAIKNGIKALAAFLFEHRGACDLDESTIIKSGAAGYFKPYKVMKV